MFALLVLDRENDNGPRLSKSIASRRIENISDVMPEADRRTASRHELANEAKAGRH